MLAAPGISIPTPYRRFARLWGRCDDATAPFGVSHRGGLQVYGFMDNAAIKLEWLDRSIALAMLTRPDQMNSIVLDVIDGLRQIMEICRQRRARSLIVTGSGRAFCGGAHIKYFTEPDSPIGVTAFEIRDNYLRRVSSLFDEIEEAPFVTIAAINGYALGGGFELALACDFRLISRTAEVGLPEVVLGATPNSGGVQKLQRFVGRGKALEWILLGEHVGPDELERRGLVYRVTEPDRLLDASLDLARRLGTLSRQGIGQAKTSIYMSGDTDLRTARRAGIEALTALIGREDWTEGMNAFVEKRQPKFE